LEDQLAYIIASVNRQLEDELSEALRPAGIPVEQARVLGILADGGGHSMSFLAEQVLVEASTLTKMIDRMLAQGLVYRSADPTDRRRILIFATREGKALSRRIGSVASAQQRRILRRLKPADAARLASLLRHVVAAEA